MARDLNTITLHGRVGKDVESRKLGDKEVVSFSLAVNDVVKGENKTQWFRINSFSGQEFIKTYIKKGDKVLVIGRLIVNEYQKQDGTIGVSVDVFANHVEKTSWEPKKEQSSPIPEVPSKEAVQAFDDGLPF